MPFLFNLILRKLNSQSPKEKKLDEVKEDSDHNNENIPEPDKDVAKTVCSMVAYVARRNNGPQLANSVTFLACGVTDQVNMFLQYIGLSSSQKTAHLALNYLSKEAQKKVSTSLSKSLVPTLAPFICVENLDFEQKIQAKSIDRTNWMFHGTWGYVHHPSQLLIDLVPSADLILDAYCKAMFKASSLDVHPQMLLPTVKEEVSWELVIKSQIADALLGYLASQSERLVSIHTKPPAVKPISSKKPDITMLKLMIASDNSAQGAGEVFESITDQSKMSATSFASRLQVVDGDLGTCTNVSTLRNQRIPSRHVEESLENVLTILGGAHTMWNISQAIYSKHVGNTSDARDLGSWRFLDSLGIPESKMTDKKDFTLMIKNIEKIHKASLIYCIMVVMETEKDPLTKVLPKLSSEKIKEHVDNTYEQFFSPEAKEKAMLHSNPKLSNLMLRLLDFTTIVEGNAAMKSGDIGRVMNVWKRWAVISQGVKSLTQYSIQLPRMIILINEVLSAGLGKLIRHSMFIAPSGRQKHFLPKDKYLEMENYMLKFLFNHSGRGTSIDRLKDVYSLNVPLSLNNCMRMCRQNNICYTSAKIDDYIPQQLEDFYAVGITKMKTLFQQNGNGLNKLRPTPMNFWNFEITTDPPPLPTGVNSDVSLAGNTEPHLTDNKSKCEESEEESESESESNEEDEANGTS
ncbi:hypothetical protein PCANC_03175 [Puccinia coronata f. sp. avenae]|uniref:DUF6589 domain-containing protein n=1 Tax=Puccinia coronata f. sp. avenae TaxID=200324 RepID=A0A2N5T865_9BASI|nr:hypothetical protein PCANC_03175 [Puccinia coronata f. sp. avenae]